MLSTSQVGRLLNLSAERVRQLADSGALKSTTTPLGRLFDEAAVDELVAARRRQRRSALVAFAGTPDAAA